MVVEKAGKVGVKYRYKRNHFISVCLTGIKKKAAGERKIILAQ